MIKKEQQAAVANPRWSHANPSQRMLGHLNVLNLLLVLTAIALFFVWDYPLITAGPGIAMPKIKRTALPVWENAAPAASPAYFDYAVVAEKNLFHPDRIVPVDKKDKQQLARPELILYGTLITSEKRLAYVEDKKSPYSTPGRGKRQVTLEEGGLVSGFKLAEVHEDSILLTRGDEKIIVSLNDQKIRSGGQNHATPEGTIVAAPVTPAATRTAPFVQRKSSGTATFQMQPAAQPSANAHAKLNIPQRRASAPLRRPVPLEYPTPQENPALPEDNE